MRKIVAAVVGLSTFLAVGGSAYATTIDPATEASGLVTDGIAEVGPVILAVAGAGLTLLVLQMGLRMAYGVIRSRGQRAV